MILFESIQTKLGRLNVEVLQDKTLVRELDNSITYDLSKESDLDNFENKLRSIYTKDIITKLESSNMDEYYAISVLRNMVKFSNGFNGLAEQLINHVKELIYRTLGIENMVLFDSDYIEDYILSTLGIKLPKCGSSNIILRDLSRLCDELTKLDIIYDITSKKYYNFTVTRVKFGTLCTGIPPINISYFSELFSTINKISKFAEYKPSQIPSSGKTGNLFYELVRVAHRILYRWDNDGDSGNRLGDGNFISTCNLVDTLIHELNRDEKIKLISEMIKIYTEIHLDSYRYFTNKNLQDLEGYQLDDILGPDGLGSTEFPPELALVIGESLRRLKESDPSYLDRVFDKDLRDELHYFNLWNY